jgi:hypothetical protein
MLNLVSVTLFLLACVAIGVVALAAPRRPRLAQLCLLVVCAFLLTNKVWSPQYSLWLVPLAVLAIPRWKPLLAWMALDALIWIPRMAYYLGPDRDGLPIEPFLGAVVIRDIAVLVLCALVLREIWRPEHDVIRQTGDDDPHGGVLDGTPHRLLLQASSPSTSARMACARVVGLCRKTQNRAIRRAARPQTPTATACAARPSEIPAGSPWLRW